MQVIARMLLKPLLDVCMGVRPVVVEDHMKVEISRNCAVNLPEKVNELLIPVTGLAFANDRAVESIQRGE